MIRIEAEPWQVMLAHARETYPNECCGAMLGELDDGSKIVSVAMPLENAFAGARAARYELRPEDLLAADRAARERNLDLIGTDLKNSCPWYSFVVLSIRKGEFDHANSWLPNADQTEAAKEELSY